MTNERRQEMVELAKRLRTLIVLNRTEAFLTPHDAAIVWDAQAVLERVTREPPPWEPG